MDHAGEGAEMVQSERCSAVKSFEIHCLSLVIFVVQIEGRTRGNYGKAMAVNDGL